MRTDDRVRALAFVGGWAHPATQTSPATAAALSALDIDAFVVDDFGSATERLNEGNTDLLVIHACRFLMTDARYTIEQRAAFASSTPQSFREAVIDHLAAGKPLLALHTAVLCFDDWPAWHQVVGGRWNWTRSNHPPPGAFEVRPIDDSALAKPFTLVDELYRFLEPSAGSEILATAIDTDGIEQPIAWSHQQFGGRVAYSSLGHDRRSLENPRHRGFLGDLVSWLQGS